MGTTRRQSVKERRDLSAQALRCHTYGHQWDPGPMTVGRNHGLYSRVPYEQRLVCDCGKVRTDFIDYTTFEVVGRTYSKPDGFDVMQPTTRDEYRQEFHRRATEQRSRH